MRVIGTAGHVDHGKSTLVRALTGIDPDRLKEEKARGMTIDLGFAWMELPRAGNPAEVESVGIVDVPGHIDFIKNMLAGVGGIDAALLVIAADEGVMPQTREHLAILNLLEVPAAIVALTKSDLAQDVEWLELLELDIGELLEGTHLADAPIVRVSATTGEGLDALRAQLSATLDALPARRDRARPRMPIDRIFTLSGFGVVVTGTLVDGALRVGDNVELLPAGTPARIRGLQSHKQQVPSAEPGSRVAINLSGIDAAQIRRGDVVARPGTLAPSTLIDVRFHLLADAPGPLRHNAPVEFFTGAGEHPAHVRLLGAEELRPGDEGFLQLRFERPVAAVAGDHFILRAQSPSMTLGGGVILHMAPGKRWRRMDPRTAARFEMLSRGAPDELLLEALEAAPLQSGRALLASLGPANEEAVDSLAELERSGAVVALPAGGEALLIARSTLDRLARALETMLAEYHALWPLRTGMARSEVRSRLAPTLGAGAAQAALTPRTLTLLLEHLQVAGLVQADESVVRLATFHPAPSEAQQAAIARTLEAFAVSPAAPPNQPDTLSMLGGDAELLDYLLATGNLVRVGGDVLFLREAFEAMVSRVAEEIAARGSLTLGDVRDLLGTSRKYVQALLEEMDSRRITRREGEARVLR
jgi:selenocysteine-specific elongation factor